MIDLDSDQTYPDVQNFPRINVVRHSFFPKCFNGPYN